jgi:hypothetical protein
MGLAAWMSKAGLWVSVNRIHSSYRMFVAEPDSCDLFSLWPRGSWVLDTNVGSKLLVSLGFVLLLHFLQRFEDDRTRGLKHPVALGATEALEVLLINPHQLAWHGRSIRLRCVKQNNIRRLEPA